VGTSSERLWGGHFKEPMDELMERFGASIDFDRLMWRQDILASMAHARMLARQGIITPEEAEAILKGLEQVAQEIAEGKMSFSPSLEDIHTHVEARLKQLIGPAAGKLHTARSRNDQVATDLRLWIMDAIRELDGLLLEYQRALLEQAEANLDIIMPGYTHLQRAQPVLFSHHLMAYLEMAWRDRQRLSDCLQRVSVLPLGAAALAGTTFPVDPQFVARELGFKDVAGNSMDAVASRDFALEFLCTLMITQLNFSRLAEELVLWSSAEFGFVSLPEGFTTGSSIMPQKKNPDAAELVRAKTGRVIGAVVNLAVVLKALPMAYNKDLQEDKPAVFDAFNNVADSARVMTALVKGLTPHPERMGEAVRGGYLNATELADWLAARGLPFREAHRLAAQAVARAMELGVGLEELEDEELAKMLEPTGLAPDESLREALKPSTAVARRTSPGATAPQQVKEAIEKARKRLWPEQ